MPRLLTKVVLAGVTSFAIGVALPALAYAQAQSDTAKASSDTTKAKKTGCVKPKNLTVEWEGSGQPTGTQQAMLQGLLAMACVPRSDSANANAEAKADSAKATRDSASTPPTPKP